MKTRSPRVIAVSQTRVSGLLHAPVAVLRPALSVTAVPWQFKPNFGAVAVPLASLDRVLVELERLGHRIQLQASGW